MQLFDSSQVTALKELRHPVAPLNIFPNPASSQVEAYLQLVSDSYQKQRLFIYNQTGQLQRQMTIYLMPGKNLITLPAPLPAGQYYVVLQEKNGMEKTGLWVVIH